MDWGNVLPNVITGAVGLAGIGGSLLSARMAARSAAADVQTSIAAETERARLSEKRRVYAVAFGFQEPAVARFKSKRSRQYDAAVEEANRTRVVVRRRPGVGRAHRGLGPLTDKQRDILDLLLRKHRC